MDYTRGRLGKHGQGIVTAIEFEMRLVRVGLGYFESLLLDENQPDPCLVIV
jgi:hypothetical protein